MVNIKTFREMALSFPEVTEQPHFEKTSFRAKKIFATLDERTGIACLMLTPLQQSLFCVYDKTVIYPVPNKWGLKGATYVVLDKVRKDMLADALTTAYCNAAPKKLAEPYLRQLPDIESL